jgi:serine-type D-Ala-D-Ala carboxypeptidase/endopeptidase
LVVAVRSAAGDGVWHRGHVPDGPRSIFEIGSITKVFTATLLADMAREGLVALDDPVQKWLPDGVRMPSRGRAITLEDLSTHRSGLPGLPHGLLLSASTRDRRDPYARLDPARLEAAIPKTPPKREPGERFRYSNYAVGLLGHLLARRAGMSYERLVRARICEPLGLTDTWVQTPEADRGRVATPHDHRGRETGHWHLAALAGAGGLRSTAADLLAFLALHASREEGGLAATARETHRRRGDAGRAGIGLGWLILPEGMRVPLRRLPADVLFHEGGTGGFRSFAAVAPASGASVVVLANQARGVSRLGWQMLREVLR